MSKLTYLWSDGMVDKIAKKVAEEPMENRVLFEGTPFEVDEGNYEYLPKRPQHIIDEEKLMRQYLNDMIEDKWKCLMTPMKIGVDIANL